MFACLFDSQLAQSKSWFSRMHNVGDQGCFLRHLSVHEPSSVRCFRSSRKLLDCRGHCSTDMRSMWYWCANTCSCRKVHTWHYLLECHATGDAHRIANYTVPQAGGGRCVWLCDCNLQIPPKEHPSGEDRDRAIFSARKGSKEER